MCLTQGDLSISMGQISMGGSPVLLLTLHTVLSTILLLPQVSKDVSNPICSKESNYLYKMRFFLKSLCQRLVPWLAQYLSIMWAPNFCLPRVSFSITTSVSFQNVSGVSCWFLPMTSPLTSWLSVTLLPSYSLLSCLILFHKWKVGPKVFLLAKSGNLYKSQDEDQMPWLSFKAQNCDLYLTCSLASFPFCSTPRAVPTDPPFL